LISIEADPEWVAAKIGAMKAAALPVAERLQIAAPLAGSEWTENGEDEEVEDEIGEGEIIEPAAQPCPPKPSPKSPPQTGAAPRKHAIIKTKNFPALVTALQSATDYYNDKSGTADNFHILGAAAKLGYPEIAGENLNHVIDALIQHAKEQTADVPELTPET